jgi:Fungal chitosanase of glycosyl hydrolase group 75
VPPLSTTLATAAASGVRIQTADIFIQAGHVNTPDRMTGASGPFGEERVWTRLVRDEAVRILSSYGLNVLPTDASWKLAPRGELLFRTKIAVYLHFDGDKEDHHTEGASIGYPAGKNNQEAADAWRQLYSRYWPYQWKADNYSTNESGYYGFSHVEASIGQFLVEFGDNEDLTQAGWLSPRLKWLAALLAYYLANQVGKQNVPLPEAPIDSKYPLFTSTGAKATFLASAATPPRLPDFAPGYFDAGAGVPWDKAGAKPQFDGYNGILPGTLYQFTNLNIAAGITSAVFYESKFAIDNDGTGGNAGKDKDHQDQTSLREADGTSLNAKKYPFAVIPLDAAEAKKEGKAPKHPGLPDFGSLGLRLGDLGVAFWREKSTGKVAYGFFCYGDSGPANSLGEGSVLLAEKLSINPSPTGGGYTTKEVLHMGKGIVHVVFPGSTDLKAQRGLPTTNRSANDVETQARQLWAKFTGENLA